MLTEEIRAILRVANLLEIYEYCEKRDKQSFEIKKRLRKSSPNESFTSGE